MNEPAQGVRTDQAENPENEQNNKDSPEHMFPLG
jgi:hypothetical protein